MKNMLLTPFCGLLLFCRVAAAQDVAKIYIEAGSTDELKSKEGQKVVVYGETKGSGKSASGTNFVNFKEAEFYLITFKSDLARFKEGEPADIYEGKRIAVEGVVTVYRDKPQIKLVRPDAVRILEADEAFPPKNEGNQSEAPKPRTPEKKTVKDGKKEPEKPKRKPPVDASKYFK